MASATIIRELRWPDIPAVEELERACFEFDKWSVESFWSELAGVPERRSYFIATNGTEIIGYAGLAIAGSDSDIQTIVVAEGARARGLGTRLIEELVREATARDCRWCHLEVREDNRAALSLYAAAGFAELSRRRGYYSGGVDAIVMRRDLRAGLAVASGAVQ